MICGGAHAPPRAPGLGVTDEISSLWAAEKWSCTGKLFRRAVVSTKKHQPQPLPNATEDIVNKCHPLSRICFTDRRFVTEDARSFLVVDSERGQRRPGLFVLRARAPGYRPGEGAEVSVRSDPRWRLFPLPDARVRCPRWRGEVRRVPCARGRVRRPMSYQLFLARWARRLSWKESAEAFRTSWDSVFTAVRAVVDYGLRNRSLGGVEAMGWTRSSGAKGHDYVTLVYQIDAGSRRLLHVARHRTTGGVPFGFSTCWAGRLFVDPIRLLGHLETLPSSHSPKRPRRPCTCWTASTSWPTWQKAVNEIRARGGTENEGPRGYEDVLKHTKYWVS